MDSKSSNRREVNPNMAASSDESRSASASLMRTRAMMKQELERISHVSNTIDRDGYLLRETTQEHKGLSTVVKGARQTLGVLNRQDMKESIVLWCSICFFYAVVLYVLWTRIPLLPW